MRLLSASLGESAPRLKLEWDKWLRTSYKVLTGFTVTEYKLPALTKLLFTVFSLVDFLRLDCLFLGNSSVMVVFNRLLQSAEGEFLRRRERGRLEEC